MPDQANAQTAMVVFNDASLGGELAEALCARGLDVWEAGSGQEALQVVEQHPVAVMIIESGLPLMSGFDLARQVRNHGFGANTALIIITDVSWPARRKAAVVQQMDLLALLSRPVDPGQVAEVALCAVDLPAGGEQAESDAQLRGTLGATPFARLLGELYRRRATGALLLHGPSKKIVYFRGGDPVYVKSNQQIECLGEVLVREGVISRGQCQESLRRMEREKRQQGEILRDMGAIGGRALVLGLEQQLRTKLLEIFTWPRGDFYFRGADSIPTEEIRLDWTTAEVIAHGVRRSHDEQRLAAALQPYHNHILLPGSDPRLRFQELTMDTEEQSLLDSVDGTRTLGQVLSLCPISRTKALAAAYIFIACGMVECA